MIFRLSNRKWTKTLLASTFHPLLLQGYSHLSKDLPIQMHYSGLWTETSNISARENRPCILLKAASWVSPWKVWCHVSERDTHIHKTDTFTSDVCKLWWKGDYTIDRATIWWSQCAPGMAGWLGVACVCRGCWVCLVVGFGVWLLAG